MNFAFPPVPMITYLCGHCVDKMKGKLNLRVEVSRLEKLHKVAEERKKTMTQLIEDWIDQLPKPEEAA